MANYLPVLLLSVSTNATPDDSSVSTQYLPRGQVDYLSHDWEEEDVWRSWRNMTRQKNEIANGVRLENASWRTWWKQRNHLSTVSPETLNWLKDSDVTWLYGPLHTAVDWTPPPRPPKPDPPPAHVHSHLDLSTPATSMKHKPILKHRSISELLTSDLPSSPLFSPPESEDDEPDDTGSESPPSLDQAVAASLSQPKRPSLPHTKSDSHITKWGNNTIRAYRKDSPPRIDPPIPHPDVPASSSDSSVTSAASDAASPAPDTTKKKHISFNTFVEQCIAIEKPKANAIGLTGAQRWRTLATTYSESSSGSSHSDDSEAIDSGDEDSDAVGSDEEDDNSTITTRTPWRASHSTKDDDCAIQSDEYDSDESDGGIEIRASKKVPRSSGSASSSPSPSRPPANIPVQPGPKRRRNSTYTTYSAYPQGYAYTYVAPPLIRTPSAMPSEHVTIAPIAPTILKTGGSPSGSERRGFGEEGNEDSAWAAWDEDVGFVSGPVPSTGGLGGAERDKEGEGEDESDEDRSTPVELVYVPPLGSNYGVGYQYQMDREREREQMKAANVPTVVLQSGEATAHGGREEPKDAYDYFEGPDLGEDFVNSGRRGRSLRGAPREPEAQTSQGGKDRLKTRSISRSRSRTPSPAFAQSSPSPSTSVSASPATSTSPGPAPSRGRGRTTSTSPPSAPGTGQRLLSPPTSVSPHEAGGYSSFVQTQPREPREQRGREQRGRSIARSSSSGSLSQQGSPMGSLSPDGAGIAAIGSAYAGGRVLERDREHGGRSIVSGERERGRERTGRRLSRSSSFEDSATSGKMSVGASPVPVPGGGRAIGSGVSPVPVPGIETARDKEAEGQKEQEDEESRHPTPANSPVVGLSIDKPAHLKNDIAPPSQLSPRSQAANPSPMLATASFPSSSTSAPVNQRHGTSASPSHISRAKPVVGVGLIEGEGNIVGKAVGMVSSAGAYLGLWQNGAT
ncbi:hypothetical protein BD779DRAFT_1511575 [Infundibulicybe gibba]|nr:hypothetical protein BD779DRAFT_1511575 [Infundibulicybe gibba]